MAKQNIPYKIYLEESEMPTSWYNLRADMKNKPAPLLNPGTGKPMTAEELSCCVDSGDALGMAEHVVSQQTAVESRTYRFTEFRIFEVLEVRSSGISLFRSPEIHLGSDEGDEALADGGAAVHQAASLAVAVIDGDAHRPQQPCHARLAAAYAAGYAQSKGHRCIQSDSPPRRARW